MAISKHMLRKMHGVLEPTGEADPVVVARLKYHVAAARWCEKYLSYICSLFALTGFAVVLLPVMLKSWGVFIQNIPILSKIFHDYSTLSGWALVNFYPMIFLLILKISMVKSTPGSSTHSCTYRELMEMELYPRTKKEEFAYWICIFFDALASTAIIFVPFSSLAYFILLRN
jgi:hypothetical protein